MSLRPLGAALALAAALAGTPAAAAPHTQFLPGSNASRPGALTASTVTLRGWITAASSAGVDASRLLCATPGGTFEVHVDGSTRIATSGGRTLTASDLEVGMKVLTLATVNADTSVGAESILVAELPPTSAGPPTTLRGRVLATFAASAATGGRNLLVLARATGAATIEVDGSTAVIRADGSAASFAALEPSQHVTVRVTGGVAGVMRASLVRLGAGAPAGPVVVQGTLRARAAASGGVETWLVGSTLVAVPAALPGAASFTISDSVRVSAVLAASGVLEARAVAAPQPAPSVVRVRGELQVRAEDHVVVNAVTIALEAGSRFGPGVELGTSVEVTARLESGRLVAEDITADAGASARVAFEGTIESLGVLGAWTVAGTRVRVGLDTELSGLPPVPGLHAEVAGTVEADGSVRAERVNVTAGDLNGLAILEGTLKNVSTTLGTWTLEVAGAAGAHVEIALAVDAQTVVDTSLGQAVAGAQAEVRAEARVDGSFRAELIRIRR